MNDDVLIIGGGIGGLTLALTLHEVGIPCRVYEAVAEVRALGVGINLLPHAVKELERLGVRERLAAVAIETKEASFYNRFGQHIYTEPLGTYAGYRWPQFSIHRGDLHLQLLAAVRERIGAERVRLGWKCVGVEQDESSVRARFVGPDGVEREMQTGSIAVGCDGINSVLRKQLYPHDPEPRYSGVTMWRGVTRMKPVLSGATFLRAGWLNPGKLVMYPIRNDVDGDGNQLMNWLAENETPQRSPRDWTRTGFVEDFLAPYADWNWGWLDVPKLFRDADLILEYPMVDQDPLDRWTFGRLTLLGDAAHPMVPRGSNGAGQSILDARVLADELARCANEREALESYDRLRVPATAKVVLTNRTNPPDAILRIVYERTGDRPFASIDDVVSRDELESVTANYKRVAGYAPEQLT
jgi:5-methylphenazine-1-carboxylate 1-monooxygenase